MHRQWRRGRLPTLRTAGRVPPDGLETPPPACRSTCGTAPLPARRSRGQHWNRRRATVAPRFSPQAVALAVTETLGEQTGNQQSSRETPGSHAEGREKTPSLPISLATMTTGKPTTKRFKGFEPQHARPIVSQTGQTLGWRGRKVEGGYLVEQSRAIVWPCAHKDLKSTPGLETFQPQALQRPTLTVVKGSSARVLRGATETIKYPVNQSTTRLKSTPLPAFSAKFSFESIIILAEKKKPMTNRTVLSPQQSKNSAKAKTR